MATSQHTAPDAYALPMPGQAGDYFPAIGETVRILAGPHRGELGRVVDFQADEWAAAIVAPLSSAGRAVALTPAEIQAEAVAPNPVPLRVDRWVSFRAVRMVAAGAVALAAAAFFVGMIVGPLEPAAAALQACTAEDSDNCYWDAATRGNGAGRSFVTLAGVTYYAR